MVSSSQTGRAALKMGEGNQVCPEAASVTFATKAVWPRGREACPATPRLSQAWDLSALNKARVNFVAAAAAALPGPERVSVMSPFRF